MSKNTGSCFCKPNVGGRRCSSCKQGYYNYSSLNPLGCLPCVCNLPTTVTVNRIPVCDPVTAQCQCTTPFITGKRCELCTNGQYNLALGCQMQCQCDTFGSLGPTCDIDTGQCACKPKIGGLKCNLCEPGYFNLTRFGCVSQCDCDVLGALNQYCSSVTGQCLCRVGYTGRRCERCMSGYWRETSSQSCKKCVCNLNGIMNEKNICDQVIYTSIINSLKINFIICVCFKQTGRCICNEFTEGYECNQCKAGYFGDLTSLHSNKTCQQCTCDQIGTDASTLVNGKYICDIKTSQCVCNPNRIGLACETCALGYFFLNLNGIDCFECACDPIGSVPGSNCDSLTGECVCKTSNGIGGTRCDQCSPGFYNFSRVTGS